MSEDLEILLAKYFAGDADEGQRKEVEDWIAESEENRNEFERYRSIWQRTNVAARYSDAVVEQALISTKKRLGGFGKQRTMTFLRQAAAVLVVAFMLSFFYNYFSAKQNDVDDSLPVMQEVTALNGMSTKVDLSDGTSVYLHPGSKLTFPVVFSDRSREVKLLGEGYFSVARNEQKPFVVKTSKMNVRVLGTKFNLRANADEDFVETILVEGKVSLEKELDGKAVEMKVLSPDQRAVYRPADGEVRVFNEKNIEKHIAWTKGTLEFDADPMSKVVKELERWYNVDIEIKDADLRKYKVTGKFEGEPIDEVLSLLQYSSGFRYKVEKRKKKDGKYQKKKIILMK